MTSIFAKIVLTSFIVISIPSMAKDSLNPLPLSPTLTLSAAKSVMEAAENVAARNKPSSIVILDISGTPILVHRMDGAFPASYKVAEGKAETALAFRTSTKAVEDSINNGRAALLSAGYVSMQGGVPLIYNGNVVGSIGVSGGTKEQDETAASAGANILSKKP